MSGGASSVQQMPGEPPVIGPGQPICTRLRGWAFSAFMLLSSLFGVIYIVTPMVPLLFWNPRLWRKCMDRLVGVWCIMPGALMSCLFGAKVTIKGDMIDYNEPGVIIMNHRTRLDWLFFWNALFKMNPWLCTSEKISMKGILKYVPGAGWAMGCNAFIFLDRSYETDRDKIDRMLDYYSKVGNGYQLLLYPEGTDKCPKATERSRIYAEKNGLVHYDYVLHPRTTGFVHIVQNMRKANYIKYLYDVTIAFGDCIVQSEVDLVSHGVCPGDVHYQVRRIPIDSLPKDDEGLAKWIIHLWSEKEEKLRRFYQKVGAERQLDNTPGGDEYKMTESGLLVQLGIVIFWAMTTVIWISAFLQVPFMFIFAVLACIFYFGVHKLYGGMEWLTIAKFNESLQRNQGARVEPVPLDPTGLPIQHSSDSE